MIGAKSSGSSARDQIVGFPMVEQRGRTNTNSLPQVQIEMEFPPSGLEFWSISTGRHLEDGAATVPSDRMDMGPRHRAGQGLRPTVLSRVGLSSDAVRHGRRGIANLAHHGSTSGSSAS